MNNDQYYIERGIQMIRYHLLVKGLVQGVGYRYFVKTTAVQLKLKGWVRNLYDGHVEVEVQGETERVNMFISHLKEGPRFSTVDEVVQAELPVAEGERGFVIRGDN